MIDRYLGEVRVIKKRVSQEQVGTTCTGHERSAIAQIANGRERQYREYGRDRGRRETTVRSRSHPCPVPRPTSRSGQARERYRSTISTMPPAARHSGRGPGNSRIRPPARRGTIVSVEQRGPAPHKGGDDEQGSRSLDVRGLRAGIDRLPERDVRGDPLGDAGRPGRAERAAAGQDRQGAG